MGLPEFPTPSPDARAIADQIRGTASAALSTSGAVVLLRHADVVAAAHQPATFSSQVSRHLQLPNGLDGEEHTAYRRLIDRYLTDARVAELTPALREIAAGLCVKVAQTGGARQLDAVTELGAVFAVR